MKKRKVVKILLGLVLINGALMPNTTFAYTYPEKQIEEKILNAKGFNMDNGEIRNYFYKEKRELSEKDMGKIDKWADEIIIKSGASKKKTQKEKAKFVAAYLKSNYIYDQEAVTNKNLWESAQVGSLALKGTAVCTGYTLGFVRVLDKMGIESYMAYAYMNGSHAVTRAYLDGVWTTIEPTGYVKKFPLLDYINKGYDYDKEIFPKSITYVSSRKELHEGYKTKYVICQEKEIEDYLSKNNFKVHNY